MGHVMLKQLQDRPSFKNCICVKLSVHRREIGAITQLNMAMNTDAWCGSPPGVMMADTLSFNAKIGLVDFWV